MAANYYTQVHLQNTHFIGHGKDYGTLEFKLKVMGHTKKTIGHWNGQCPIKSRQKFTNL